ncbi:glycosyltransferase family 4 protein [Nocardioides anomalus]|uniref:Glycosyltransferase family 4 protein n=1 Tax=Nocardioides anomalus TaxID=2712223 RepID=A0A6G6WDY9_9ACTN|nr:glycosyltransferase family 4 protein [Nocardioides anomalus]QIG43367.1 glycosyltransferase family 4 protein [Nocardioides anomalus]
MHAFSAAMRERFDVVGRLDTELSAAERLQVAAATYRPSRARWTERFYKSNRGVELRSRHARAGLATADAADVVFQTHALFETSDARTVMYVDCTHQQSMAQWPAWNPLRGRSLERWLARERRQYHAAAHLFAFCTETATSLATDYGVPADRITVVGAGLNFETLPEPDTDRDGRGDTAPTVLFVGNDFKRKGGPQLLAAFADVRHRIPTARLWVVGTPHRLPAEPGVTQLGRIGSREELSRLYARADVFCLPSLFDPFPGALLEAMASGLPSVVTATCGVPEMVVEGTTATTVGRGDTMISELTGALVRLLLDADERSRMGAAARRRVEERFLWSHVVDRMAPAIERLAAPVATQVSR